MKKGWILLTIAAAFIALGFMPGNANAGAVTGVVIDAEGAVVPGAMVTLRGLDRVRGERPFHAQMETGENGTFGFREVPQGHYMIQAGSRELGAARQEIGVREDAVVRVELQLIGRRGGNGGERPEPEYGSVAGMIVDVDGAGIANAVVMLVPVRERGERGRRAPRARGCRVQTDEQGAFEFAQVPVGNYTIMAGARGYTRASDEIEVVADQATRVRLMLEIRE